MAEDAEKNTDETSTAEVKEKKELKAKTVSLVGKIVGGVVILVAHILKWTGKLPEATSTEIVGCGLAIMACFGTVDLNIIIDKFTKRRTDD